MYLLAILVLCLIIIAVVVFFTLERYQRSKDYVESEFEPIDFGVIYEGSERP